MATILPNLPEAILLEIFTRMPAKSVGRCRCLSKQWLTNLSTPQFINSHLTRTKSHPQENLLLISYTRALHTTPLPITEEAVSKELSGLPGKWHLMFGSCNGLVLMLNDEDELFLVNPVIQQQVRVPDPPFPSDMKQKRYPVNEMYGFGYDISKDDYKILSIATYFYHQSDGTEVSDTLAHVYSLKMGDWKTLPCEYGLRPYGGVTAGALVNGVIHWLSHHPHIMFSTFNFDDEVFGVIPLPDNHGMSQLHMASVLRGCLVLVGEVKLNRELKVSIMEEYGVHESWTNFTISIRGTRSVRIDPLCFVGEKEVILWGDGSILLGNLETQETKTMVVNGACPYSGNRIVFVESLVSPSSFTSVAEEDDGTNSANNTLVYDGILTQRSRSRPFTSTTRF